ncbi:MAG TPA: SRPBCC family protein [Acidimicrobiia bacterium]
MADQVSVTQEIAAPAEQVWAMVSDVTRMGEWSPENEGATWLGGAKGAAPGAKFKGSNRNGKKKWNTVAKVAEADAGRAFAFHVTAAGFKVAEWRYAFEPTATGCRVTETWIDERGMIAKSLGGAVSGVSDREAHNRAGMEQTLERLKAAAESAATPS